MNYHICKSLLELLGQCHGELLALASPVVGFPPGHRPGRVSLPLRTPHCQPIAPGKASSSQCQWCVQQHLGSSVGLLRSCQVWKNLLIFSRTIQVQDLILFLKSSLPITIGKHKEFVFQPGRSSSPKALPHHIFFPQIRA